MYMDGDKERILKGKIIAGDDHFVTILLPNGSRYMIGKNYIVSMRIDNENSDFEAKNDEK